MKQNSVYFFLIIFSIFVLIHKIVALIILFNAPLKSIRYYLNIIEPLVTLYFLLFFKLNTYLRNILLIFLIAPLKYWIGDRGLIYYVVNNNPSNNKVIDDFNLYGDIVINIFVTIYIIYALFVLFFTK